MNIPISSAQDVQAALNQLGYHGANGQPLTVDGAIGPNSTFAVKAFQTDHALSVDGIPGPVTKAALTAALALQGEPQATIAIQQDNASGPTIAVHVPAVPATAITPPMPAMTVHTTTDPVTAAVVTAVKPFGTPGNAASTLARVTGASPSKAAPLALHAATMSKNAKLAIGAAVAGAIGLAWAKAKGKL